MTTPTHCTSCGHGLGIGRFCTNCGKPVPGRHPEAAPASGAPPASPLPQTVAVPPPVGSVPPAARYPLFADTATSVMAPSGPPPPTPPGRSPHGPQVGPPPAAPPSDDITGRRGAPAWLPWLTGLILLTLVTGVGGLLLIGSGDERRDASEEPSRQRADGTGDPTTAGSALPDSTGTGGPVEQPEPGQVVELTGRARAQVPDVAGLSRDRQNNPVDFEAPNLLDGAPRTSWRMPGDGSGETLSFDLGDEVVLTEVGLINGYAKVDGSDDWYRGNRRIRAVQWEFDDGTRITQDLVDHPRMQMIDVGAIESTTIRLHLVTVTPPGGGPNGRDFTAISEVRFLGAGR